MSKNETLTAKFIDYCDAPNISGSYEGLADLQVSARSPWRRSASSCNPCKTMRPLSLVRSCKADRKLIVLVSCFKRLRPDSYVANINTSLPGPRKSHRSPSTSTLEDLIRPLYRLARSRILGSGLFITEGDPFWNPFFVPLAIRAVKNPDVSLMTEFRTSRDSPCRYS